MAVARAALLDPLFEKHLDVVRSGLVIGGGVAGMTAALGLARQGFEVVLVEKEKELGGLSRRIAHTIEGRDVQEFLAGLIEEVKPTAKLKSSPMPSITGFSGYKGNFVTKVETGEGSGRGNQPRRYHSGHRRP